MSGKLTAPVLDGGEIDSAGFVLLAILYDVSSTI